MDGFLIIRLSSLGDIIHTLPAFAALRKTFPEARITWAVESKGKEILDLVPGIDRVVVIEKKTWFRDAARTRQGNQIAFDFQGLLKSAFLSFLSRSPRRIGFHKTNLKEPPASLFYTETADKLPEEGVHVIAKNLGLLTRVGISITGYDFPLQIPQALSIRVRARLTELGYTPDRKLIICNVGAAWETKRWFAEKWAGLMELLKPSAAFLLLLWGNEAEKRLAQDVGDRTGIPLAPNFSIPEVMALINDSALLISGDTFALQAACALSVPVVGIFGPTNPRRNGPFDPRDKVAFHKMDCNPCYKSTCPTLECLKKITPETVAALALRAMEKHA